MTWGRTQRHNDLQANAHAIVISFAVVGAWRLADLRVHRHSDGGVLETFVPRTIDMLSRVAVEIRPACIANGKTTKLWVRPTETRRVLVLETRALRTPLSGHQRVEYISIPWSLSRGTQRHLNIPR